MLISSRGKYGLRVIVDLAEHENGGYIPMKEVAKRQDISLKYLEQILPTFVKNGLIEGVHGKGGGYRLTRKPEEYTLGEILRLTEGDLAKAPDLFHHVGCIVSSYDINLVMTFVGHTKLKLRCQFTFEDFLFDWLDNLLFHLLGLLNWDRYLVL